MPSEALLNKPVDCVLLGVSGAWWFLTSLGCTVPLCTPYILALAGIVLEIDKGTRVLTHSPSATHKRHQYRRYRPLPCFRLTSSVLLLLLVVVVVVVVDFSIAYRI